MPTIDLNADLGETVGGVATADDEAMFAVVSSASIACGGHAGDDASMRDAVAAAGRVGVAIGAHPSFVDRAGFGRVALDVHPRMLRRQVAEQLAALVAAGAAVRYVKPHGALYHVVSADRGAADAVVAATLDVVGPVPVLGQGGAIRDAAAAAGLPFVVEAFLDRGYLPDGSLVPRGRPGDLLDDPGEVAARAVRLVREGTVEAVDGTPVEVAAESLCVHGDTPDAVAMARAVRDALQADGIRIAPPW